MNALKPKGLAVFACDFLSGDGLCFVLPSGPDRQRKGDQDGFRVQARAPGWDTR